MPGFFIVSDNLLFSADGCLRCGEAGDRHAERTAGNVVQTDFMAEGDGAGFSAMFATDTQSDIFAGGATLGDRDTDEFADAFGIENLERIVIVDAPLDVIAEEFTGIVA